MNWDEFEKSDPVKTTCPEVLMCRLGRFDLGPSTSLSCKVPISEEYYPGRLWAGQKALVGQPNRTIKCK
jgi:hypothetical protein